MSEQVSAKHGPAEDEHIKRQDLTDIQEHGDEWPDPEERGEWPDNGMWAPEARFGSSAEGPDFRAIELRSELARKLDRTTFPATREQIVGALASHQAQQPIVDLVSALPPHTSVDSVGDLVRAIGLPVEGRRP